MHMPQRLLPSLLFCALTPVVTLAAHANTLLGTSVTGTLASGNPTPDPYITTTDFSPSLATIGPGAEFTGTLTFRNYTTFTITADFSATGLTVTTRSPLSYGEIAGNDTLILTFTDSAFLAPLSLQSYSCNTAVDPGCYQGSALTSSTISGSTVRLDIFDIRNGDIYNFTEPGTTAVTPEPSSFVLAATGLAGLAGMLRRRYAGEWANTR